VPRPGLRYCLALFAIALGLVGCRAEDPVPSAPTAPAVRAPAPVAPPLPAPSPRKKAASASWLGEVVEFTDGDTCNVSPVGGGKPVPIRVFGVDAPELAQSYGPEAREVLRALVVGQAVTVKPKGTSHTRTVARLTLPDGRDVGAELVAQGAAWWSREYAPTDRPLSELEARAKAERRGLWVDPSPTPPEEFRHPGYAKIIEEAGRGDDTPGLVWVTARGACYHRESCPTLQGGGREVTRQEALAAKLSPCKKCRP